MASKRLVALTDRAVLRVAGGEGGGEGGGGGEPFFLLLLFSFLVVKGNKPTWKTCVLGFVWLPPYNKKKKEKEQLVSFLFVCVGSSP